MASKKVNKDKKIKCALCRKEVKESECSTSYKCAVCKDCASDLAYYGSE